uniref:XK-related protein n=1 Tax=Lepisosteus oculatus TaxID=7918 RepID=W5M8Q3_LEPOC|nr:PREDICTED: XK-related protein 9 [Lepisosteus oculatus]XP_015209209.1 PREDICTED: XK-related protein 9 [Lepisosteus oculatus]XP_015209210.1 PREDICTED: XK-related protein 9 [Lepisosteus oculatus]
MKGDVAAFKEYKPCAIKTMQYSKRHCFWTVVGVLTYLLDIGTDVWVAFQYFMDGRYAWFALTLLFVVSATVTIQIFSYSWFKDDRERERGEETQEEREAPGHCIFLLHLLQMGIFTRYIWLLGKGLKAMKSRCSVSYQGNNIHCVAFAEAADVSMLRLFETFLESVPQLVLQLYIILEYGNIITIQYITILTSFFSIAWATVDYQRCLRRSLHYKEEMQAGLSTVVYLLYKLFTVTSRVLSIILLTILNVVWTSALVVVWLFGTLWAFRQKTTFCTSKTLEVFYRMIVGVFLVFTFFNVKGQNTKVSMTIYYILSALQTLFIMLVIYFLKPSAQRTDYFFPICITVMCTFVLGIICLVLYYKFFHPKKYCVVEPDEVDGLEVGASRQKPSRMNTFVQQ